MRYGPTAVLAVALVCGCIAPPARAGGPLVSGQLASSTIGPPLYRDAWTFVGAVDDRVLISAIATSGTLNTVIYLYPPGGGAPVAVVDDRLDFQLTTSGTWTAVVQDDDLSDAGGYNISLLNVSAGPLTSVADPNGGPIASAAVVSGQMNAPGDFDAFTFTVAAGARVLISAITTSGTLNTLIYLYPPGGGAPMGPVYGRLDDQLPTSGTWTAVVQDDDLKDAGGYNISLLNVSAGPLTNVADPDGGPIASAAVVSGQMNAPGDFDAFTFTVAAGARVLISAIATSGTLNTLIYLYPPGGGAPMGPVYGRVDDQLLASGTWTAVVQDDDLKDAGSYNISLLNVSAGPLTNVADPDGGPIASAAVVSGQMNAPGDFDAFTFTGTIGDRILFAAIETGGAGFDTQISLYPPNGGERETFTSGGNRLDQQLLASGTYTVVIEDNGLTHTGNYKATLLNLTAGPLTSGADPDGGTIASAQTKSGTTTVPDLDAYQFTVTAGARVLISAIATSGALNTLIYLYPPGGGAPVGPVYGRLDDQLLGSGTWTAVVQDDDLKDAGSYNISLLNVSAGPLTNVADPDGGPIASAAVVGGQMNAPGDFDAFTFTVAAGARVLISAITTSGTLNALIYLYPPGGGAPMGPVYGRLDDQLPTSGTWTAVVQDDDLKDAGNYNISLLNVSAGPLTNVADPDGGPIASAAVVSGQMNAPGDFDAFTFTGTIGDRILFGAIETGGAGFDTQISLYPPNGGERETFTSGGNRLDQQLLASGTYTVVIEDNGLTHTGSYKATLLNLTAGPLTSGADPDGGTIASAQTKSGTISPAPDFDAFRFTGTPGDTARFYAQTLAGGLARTIFVYPPHGAPIAVDGASDFSFVLTSPGIHTIVIQDATLDSTGSYRFALQLVTPTTAVAGGPGPDGILAMSPAYPNPSIGEVSLAFSLPVAMSVRLQVYDATGALVRTLADETLGPGRHEVSWEGRDGRGRLAPSGIYYARLEAGARELIRKLVRVW